MSDPHNLDSDETSDETLPPSGHSDSVDEDPDSFEEISPGKRQVLHKIRRVERDTPNTSTESLDPHRNSRVSLATPCSRRNMTV